MGQERGVEHSAKAPQRRHLIPMQSVRVAQAGDFHLLPHCTNQLCGPLEQPLRPGLEQLRVVTAAADEPKVAMLRGLSLKPVEQWWVKPVDPSGTTAASGRVEGSGFGIVGPAPPVFMTQAWPPLWQTLRCPGGLKPSQGNHRAGVADRNQPGTSSPPRTARSPQTPSASWPAAPRPPWWRQPAVTSSIVATRSSRSSYRDR